MNILVVRPGVVKRVDKRRLNESGIVVIETDDPQSVKFITPVELSGSELLTAAMIALDNSALHGPKADMVRIMRAMLERKTNNA